MEPQVIQSTAAQSKFLRFETNIDLMGRDALVSLSEDADKPIEAASDEEPADKAAGDKNKAAKVHLCYLRVELERVRTGMADYLIRVGAPKNEADDNTVLTMRGGKKQGSADGAKGTARVIIREMRKKGDKSFDWEKADVEALADMLFPALKFFSGQTGMQAASFVTEALS